MGRSGGETSDAWVDIVTESVPELGAREGFLLPRARQIEYSGTARIEMRHPIDSEIRASSGATSVALSRLGLICAAGGRSIMEYRMIKAARDERIAITCMPEQVCAILDRRQHQIRFSIKPKPSWTTAPGPLKTDPTIWGTEIYLRDAESIINNRVCPYGSAGNLLYVREGIYYSLTKDGFYFVADDAPLGPAGAARLKKRFYNSAQMPRSLCRITLKVMDVYPERIQNMSRDDCIAEGVYSVIVPAPPPTGSILRWVAPGVKMTNYAGDKDDHAPAHLSPRDAFECLWNHRWEKRGFGWLSNPWTWVIAFKQVKVR